MKIGCDGAVAGDFPEVASGPFSFATKGVTLERLLGRLTLANLCDQEIVTTLDWQNNREEVVARIIDRFAPARLAVRSSAANEDGWNDSQAGVHLSLMNVEPVLDTLARAVDEVVKSYVRPSAADQVLIQPMVENVVISGVALSRDLDTGSPYYVINYDDFSGHTHTVTGGHESKTILVHRRRFDALRSPRFGKFVQSIIELEEITDSQELDIEFCITRSDTIYILQVRPLAARRRWQGVADGTIDDALDRIRSDIAERMRPRAGVAGRTTIFGEMPDWNPAEMIGNAPRPLALSLYKHLITDGVWSEARALMGYRRVEAPLLVDFCGRPYIDVRHSLNSFLPAGIDAGLADRLIDHQIDILSEHHEFHDKIEFEVAVTCRDLAFTIEDERLRGAGLSATEAHAFENALADITQKALLAGAERLNQLLASTRRLLEAGGKSPSMPPQRRVRELLAECKTFGTLPFAQLARHGFIAILFLQSMVKCQVLSEDDAARFMHGIHTVAADLVHDMHALETGTLEREAFLARYGHLRPGTYDILSWRYDERPELFLGHANRDAPATAKNFKPTSSQRAAMEALLGEAGYDVTPEALLAYIIAAVKAREEAKFAFSRSVSDALSLLVQWGETAGFSREDLSFLPIDVILSDFDCGYLRERVAAAMEASKLTRAIRLPHLIYEPSDIDVVRIPLGQPTFITDQAVTAAVSYLTTHEATRVNERIVLIESADPGFDWIFSHNIAGLITKYGGTNSHMAIRCAEFCLPAAIGCGERLFDGLVKAKVIEMNCATRTLSGL